MPSTLEQVDGGNGRDYDALGLASNCRLDFCVDNKTQTHQVKEVVLQIMM